MARIEYPDLSGGSEELQSLIRQTERERGGQMLNLYRMLLHSPPVASGWLHLGTAVRQQAALSGRYRELAICLVATLTDSDYEWHQHAPIARREGVTDEQLEALPQWRDADCFDEREQAVLSYAEDMTLRLKVDDAAFSRVRESFDPTELVELTVTVGFYSMVARFLIALEVDIDAD